MTYADLRGFIDCYNPANRHERRETFCEGNPDGRFRRYTYGQIKERDKTSLDIFWIKDKSLTDLDSLPDPDALAGEIIDSLESALESFRSVAALLE
jgi:type I restriction enzyme M protein